MPKNAREKEQTPELQIIVPLEERIRRRAYQMYVARGCQPRSELDDWLHAEQEIRAEINPDQNHGRSTLRSGSGVMNFLRGVAAPVIATMHRVTRMRIPLWATVAVLGLGLIVPLTRLAAALL